MLIDVKKIKRRGRRGREQNDGRRGDRGWSVVFEHTVFSRETKRGRFATASTSEFPIVVESASSPKSGRLSVATAKRKTKKKKNVQPSDRKRRPTDRVNDPRASERDCIKKRFGEKKKKPSFATLSATLCEDVRRTRGRWGAAVAYAYLTVRSAASRLIAPKPVAPQPCTAVGVTPVRGPWPRSRPSVC